MFIQEEICNYCGYKFIIKWDYKNIYNYTKALQIHAREYLRHMKEHEKERLSK